MLEEKEVKKWIDRAYKKGIDEEVKRNAAVVYIRNDKRGLKRKAMEAGYLFIRVEKKGDCLYSRYEIPYTVFEGR